MCKICETEMFHPEDCPLDENEDEILCDICGGPIRPGRPYILFDGEAETTVCGDCADEMAMTDIADLTGTEDTLDLLVRLGGRKMRSLEEIN